MNSFLKILKLFLIWRIALIVPVILAIIYIPLGNSYPFSEINYYKRLEGILSLPLLTAWSNFDGVHYINIAYDGYTTEARFFPLFPILIFLTGLEGNSFGLTYITALILPNIFFIGALIGLYKLLKLDYPEDQSIKSIIYLLVFPTSFFFVTVYTESLFLFLLVLAFYLAREKKWIWSVLVAMLLISTRFVGVFIIPALIFEYILQNPGLNLKNYLNIGAGVLISLTGLTLYSIFNFQKWGNFLYFLTAHSELNNGRSASSLITPPQTIYRYLKILTSIPINQYEWWIALFEIISFILVLAILILCFRKKIRKSYLIFSLPAFLLPSFSGTFSGLPRYVLVLFPLIIFLSLINNKWLIGAYSVISVIMLCGLLALFSRSYFVA